MTPLQKSPSIAGFRMRLFQTLALFSSLTVMVAASPVRVASISKYEGKVGLKRSTGQKSLVNHKRTPLFHHDSVYTSDSSKASIVYSDGSRVDLNEKSKIFLEVSGRQREIAVRSGSLKSDIKKIAGMRTVFRTPAGVAAVKGTLVDCEVLTDTSIRISADLGLLTHEINDMKLSMDVSKSRCAEIDFDSSSNSARVQSIRGMFSVQVDDISTDIQEGGGVSLTYDKITGIVGVNGVIMNAEASNEGMSFVMDEADSLDFFNSGSGYTATVKSGVVMVKFTDGSRMGLKSGETSVRVRKWLEPETPEGIEVMIPPGM